MRVSMIAVMSEQSRVIGHDNDLPRWSVRPLRPDMKRFRELTTGHPVIMGRRTWDSLDPRYKPLPNRSNIVITSGEAEGYPSGVLRARGMYGALELALHQPGCEERFIIGGQSIYEVGMSYADRLYLTLVAEEVEGDRFFPDYSTFSKEIERVVVPDFTPRLTFLTLERP